MTNAVRQKARRHYQRLVDKAAIKRARRVEVPPEGWLATMRKALGMSGAQLGRRAGLSRARISQAEAAERAGGITLKSIQDLAAAMGCRFVYALIADTPSAEIGDVIDRHARKKAEALAGRAAMHMALEKQDVDARDLSEEIRRLAADMARRLPPGFWDE
jgi:predicted DNA-binding mobile mystery protein A